VETARDLADRIETAYRHRLGNERYTIDDLPELVGGWWLCGEELWPTWVGHVLPLCLRQETLTQEQWFAFGDFIERLDGLSHDGRNDLFGVKLRDINKIRARAWRKVVPAMSKDEINVLIEFLKSPFAGYDPNEPNDLVAWWEWAATHLNEETEEDAG